jgi:type I restriction enzyme R subunit
VSPGHPQSPNFGFLQVHDPLLVALGAKAERYFAEDPVTCLINLRQFGEVLARRAAASLGLYSSPEQSQLDLLSRLRDVGALNAQVRQLFHDLRRAGNAAAHETKGTHAEALHQLKMARELGIWFHRSFKDAKFKPGPFIPPSSPADETKALAAELDRLRREVAEAKLSLDQARAAAEAEARLRLSVEDRAKQDAEEREVWRGLAEENERKLNEHLARLQAEAEAKPAKQLELLTAQAQEAGEELDLSEADTRRIIDGQLRLAGWEVDSLELTFASGARPQKGRDMAISEWPTASGPADYVLFSGLDVLAVVEAKRKRKDVSAAITQAKRYSEGFEPDGDQNVLGRWGKYRVPFLFATNGRPYLKQLEQKSGIWFLDARRPTNHPRALQGWYSPEGLRELLRQDQDKAEAALKVEPTDYLGLRDYQVKAIHAVEQALEKGQRQALIAMATGTGKTRTFIGLIYRLIKTARFRRVLFIVDRNALGDQAESAFRHAQLENLQSFTQIFNVKGFEDLHPDPETKLHFATVQSMLKRILYPSKDEERPGIDDYDCIVIDECHRGYTLDREMSEAELTFRDQHDYISKYRRVLEHFDAARIGLTATPALHTTEIFGDPVYQYSYREAVIDGWLVDHEPPIRINTELARKGIHWNKGEKVSALNSKTAQIDLIHLPDELNFDVDAFNRAVVTENFNRVVCEELARQIDPGLDGKTLIFCATRDHADLVVRLLKEALDKQYGGVDDNAVMRITGDVDRPLEQIRRFKNERYPNFVATVDLLTTGIDVPPITNLVFLRRVRSRILYEQMLGRATRLCPDINKEFFRIYDAVDLYSALEPFTSMKPVVANPSFTFADLAQELATVQDDAGRQQVLDQLLAKLQRKRRTIEQRSSDRFEAAAGVEVGVLLDQLRHQSPAEAMAWFKEHPLVATVLDGTAPMPQVLYVSEHMDNMYSVERGYGPGRTRPQDYLDEFGKFIRENGNKLPALNVVVQRPRDLTRNQLKELKLALDQAGFNEAGLQTAWRETTNQDIAASIIGFIRQRALGEPLVPYTERVAGALKRLVASRQWTENQRKWLERIGKQLQEETVMDRDALDRAPFKASGGFKYLDRQFNGQLEQILGDLTEALWQEKGQRGMG